MNVILLGPQGSGKGTQAELLAQKFGLQYFEAGKILRSVIDPAIQEKLKRGELVPDEYMLTLVEEFLKNHNLDKGILFDGYPRSVAEYEDLKKVLGSLNLRIDWVINIEISPGESVRRLLKRGRADDHPDSIQRRLSTYRAQTHPVFEMAVGEGIGFEVNGEQPIDKVFQNIVAKLSP